jgi:uncharacterized LabA/DUF88 family protein
MPNELERVCIYVDAQNFRSIMLKTCRRGDLDIQKFQEFLLRGRELKGCYYYDAPLFDTPEWHDRFVGQQKLHSALSSIDYTHVIVGKRTWRDKKCRSCDQNFRFTIEKGVDVLLATGMIRGALEDQYDTGILVSGDADFIPVVETIHHINIKKMVEVACFRSGHSRQLRETCDRRILLEERTFQGMWMH